MADKRQVNVPAMWGAAAATALMVTIAAADSGLSDLINRLGEGNQPTGAGVVVMQIEAQPSGSSNYAPDPSDSQLDVPGREYFHMSGDFDPLGHATQVGRRFYGTNGIAPGILTIYNYGALPWVQNGYLNTGQTNTPPEPTPGDAKVFNHSWVGSFTGDNDNNNALRRADYAVLRDDVIIVTGASMPSVPGYPALMGPMFNGIMVGIQSGLHTTGDVPAGLDGAGRMTPDIVAAGSSTSWSTPRVSGAAALLVETARLDDGTRRSVNPNAERSEVIKAVLMAGAVRSADWTNNPITSGLNRGITERPLDEELGSGVLDVNIAHLILTAGQQPGSPTVPDQANIEHIGWDYIDLGASRDAYYRFTLPQRIDQMSVLATWHRSVSSPNFQSWVLPDFNLELWKVTEQGSLQPLVGNFGLGVFEAGNVVSRSDKDNAELLHIHGLEPGEYVIQLSRDDLLPDPRFWSAAIAWHIPLVVCEGDVNLDGIVNVLDLLDVISNWGSDGSDGGDANGDGIVNVLDLLLVISNWGAICAED